MCSIPGLLESKGQRTCQGFTGDQDKEKDKDSQDEGWNSQKWLSDPVEKKMKEGKRRIEEKTPVSSSKALFRFSSPIGSFTE